MIKLKKEKMAPTWKVPFDKDGNQLSKIYRWSDDIVDYKDNYEFVTVLEYKTYYTAASSIHVKWKDIKSGATYTSTGDTLHQIVAGLKGTMRPGNVLTVIGKFTFYKQGKSVFLKIV